jgi:hypothetical protein
MHPMRAATCCCLAVCPRAPTLCWLPRNAMTLRAWQVHRRHFQGARQRRAHQGLCCTAARHGPACVIHAGNACCRRPF